MFQGCGSNQDSYVRTPHRLLTSADPALQGLHADGVKQQRIPCALPARRSVFVMSVDVWGGRVINPFFWSTCTCIIQAPVLFAFQLCNHLHLTRDQPRERQDCQMTNTTLGPCHGVMAASHGIHMPLCPSGGSHVAHSGSANPAGHFTCVQHIHYCHHWPVDRSARGRVPVRCYVAQRPGLSLPQLEA